ncbi:MAG: efflux transporter outer membrane subunit [Burkholderiales bacterium]|nr:efflux transporter outer membrane subunit [Burkholderiales bacterium]
MKNLSLLLSMLLLAGCAVGPDYVRPSVDTGITFKEMPPGWTNAAPADQGARGEWWRAYGDPVLNDLVAKVAPNNQTVQVALANYRQARSAVQESRAGFLPTLGVSTAATRGKSQADPTVKNSQALTLDASWEVDLWGGIRRSVEAGEAKSAGSGATLAAALLSAQAELVQDYLQLRIVERQRKLTQDTADGYRRTRDITRNQLKAGIVTPVDVAQAESQLKSAEAQLFEYDLSRQQYEHAIATLIGVPPSSFTLPASDMKPNLPQPVVSLPSELLERRPDVAAAERAVAAANAEIGVAKAAYFPSLSLSANGGNVANRFSDLFSTPARTWSVGATLAETLFDGGARSARSDEARAAYDATAAQYRQTVLGALQEVEDNLAALHFLADEADRQNEAVVAARDAERLALNEYKAGVVDFTVVSTNQAARHQAEINALQIEGRRYSASAMLIKALGGGWDGKLDDQGLAH